MKPTDSDNKARPVRRQRLRLPFEKQHSDLGEWAYDHRAGLCITLIAYLVLAIAFVAGKIVVGGGSHSDTIYIDLQQLEQLAEEKARLEEQIRRKNADNTDWRKIQNLVSNENAQQEGTQGSQGVSDAADDKALKDRMKANRDAYQKGLAEEQAILNQRESAELREQTDQRVSGRVTVSYSFSGPVRRHRANCLEVPAYRCEGGGEVVVEARLSRSGDVTAARIVSGGDDCMRETALRAVRNSCFNIDGDAPQKQVGTITYVFIPQ